MYKTLVKLSLIIALLGLLSCQQTSPHKVLFVEGETQGTSYHISYTDTLQRNLKPQIDSILADFSKELSTYDSTSTISRFNRTKKGMRLRGYFATVLLESERINQLTHGAFDPTVMPLVNFWGFGTKKAAETIDTSQLAGILKLVGMDKLEIHKLPPTGVVVTKKHAGVALDFNAIAQGYTCDVLGNYLQKNGIKNFLIEVGGEMLAAGKKPGDTFWKVGIDKPEETASDDGRELQATVMLQNQAIATSGNYRKFHLVNGKKVVHTLNPKTGMPQTSDLLSVSIIAPKCITADALATACMVMGFEKAKAFIETQENTEALFIYENEGKLTTYMTKNFNGILLP